MLRVFGVQEVPVTDLWAALGRERGLADPRRDQEAPLGGVGDGNRGTGTLRLSYGSDCDRIGQPSIK